jgi:hypothetical protein
VVDDPFVALLRDAVVYGLTVGLVARVLIVAIFEGR